MKETSEMSTSIRSRRAGAQPTGSNRVDGGVIIDGPYLPGNTVLADLEAAMESYAEDHIVVDIYSVNPPGDVFNEGESLTFKVRARNTGPMHVDDLVIKMTGRNGCRVGEHGWTSGQIELSTETFPRLTGKMASDEWVEDPTDHYHLFAGAAIEDADLLEISVSKWNADWGYILVNRSLKSEDANAVYHGDVVAQ